MTKIKLVAVLCFCICFVCHTSAQLINIQRQKLPDEKVPCTNEEIEKAMNQQYKAYGYAELERCEKWHVNKSKEEVLKLFNGYAFKKGFSEKKELYLGPLFYNRRPNGVQDVFHCYLYDGLNNRRMGNTMAFSNAYVFYKFWLDTTKHHIVPLLWNTPAAYIPPRYFGVQQGTYAEWQKATLENCLNPNDIIMKNIYVVYFLYWQDYSPALAKMKEDAKTEVNNYKMQSLADAAYYDYYYGPNGKTGIKWSEDVIKKNAENWPMDSLNTFIRHFPYSKSFNEFAAIYIEAQKTIPDIITAVREFSTVPFNKQKVEATLLSLCSSLREIGLLRSMPGFTQLKQIEAKAFTLAKAEKTISAYETFLEYYATGTSAIEIKKLRDAELKRIEDDRLARLKVEGPGGIWHIDGPELGSYLWVNTYKWKVVFLDKTSTSFYCEFFPQVTSVSVGTEKIFDKAPNPPKTYFRIGNIFYLYQNINYAAKAWYKIKKGEAAVVYDGLIEVRDETPSPVPQDEYKYYQIYAKEKNDCSVHFDGRLNNIASIQIEDGGVMSASVVSDQYYSSVYDKNQKQVFQTNDPFEDNGLGSPYVSSYDLPATVVINYKKTKSSDMKQVVVKIFKPGSYNIKIN